MWRLSFLMIASLCSASVALAQVQTQYTIVPLQCFPSALDPSGPLVGVGTEGVQPALCTEAGPALLGLFPDGTFGAGEGVCGAYATGYAGRVNTTHAFLAIAGQPTLQDLGEGDAFSAGRSVNCRGEVAGQTQVPDPTDFRVVPAWWDVDGERHDLETFQDTGGGAASVINAFGAIAGSADVGRNAHCAFWPADTHAIHDCGVDPDGQDFSFGMDLSDDSHIVGVFFLVGAGTPQRGFLREPDGTIVVLEPVDGEQQSLAFGINNAGLVVGFSLTDPPRANAPFSSQCTLWQDDASPTPPVPIALSTLVTNGEGWDLRVCLGVNRNGVLLGSGTLNGVRTAFLAIPTEPVVDVPPAPIPAPEQRRVRRTKDHDGPAQLPNVLAHWQARQAQSQDKVARWEAARQAWKQAHQQ
jgi:uncharacterized membrane protein